MYVDSKTANLLPLEGVVDSAESQLSTDMEMRAHVIATISRTAFFLSLLAFCVVYSYHYAAAVFFNGKDFPSSGLVGFLVAFMAALEMSMADLAKKLRFCYIAREPSISYSFIVIGGLATTGTLLLHEFLNGSICANVFFTWLVCVNLIHVMAMFAVATIILGVAIIWHCVTTGGEEFLETRW